MHQFEKEPVSYRIIFGIMKRRKIVIRSPPTTFQFNENFSHHVASYEGWL
jgi:hypothetical protein